ncbi:unnamed protein product [Allacma fusca]|uniref:C2H2-type domain-containing protein n=1 Tax=Allacma fusca TaxID=39272 RepID=A0A8J2MCX0_9HEXA|nr:unnamed protein product [Allacma fusca]
MLAHLRVTHINAAESYICDVCGKVFSRRDSFNSHKYIHKPDRPTYVCHVCGKSFKRKRNLTKHLELHDPTFSCEFCEAKFPSDFKLRSHRFIHTGEKPFKCKHCPEEFRTRKGLCRHSMYRHGKRVGGTTNETNENDDDNEEQLPSFILKVEHDTADDDQHDDKFHAGGLTNDAGNTEEGVTSVVVEQIKFG